VLFFTAPSHQGESEWKRAPITLRQIVTNQGLTTLLYDMVASAGSATAMHLCNLTKVHSSVIEKNYLVYLA
jgi:hypothetical protein